MSQASRNRARTGSRAKAGGSRARAGGARDRHNLLDRSDIRAILTELSTTLAPADVHEVMKHEVDLREQAGALMAEGLPLFSHQLLLALDCLRDHLNGQCPQIPYHTITLMAGAVYYFAERVDVVPDFLPRIGHLDDAVVMALAFETADAGLRRYCSWKGIEPDGVLTGRGNSRKRPAAERAR